MKLLTFLRNTAGAAGMAFLLLVSCTKDKDYQLSQPSDNPSPNAITPGEASANDVVTLTGSGLGGVMTIVFERDSVLARFNPAFNTDNAVIFRIPEDAIPSTQKIVFTNRAGKQFSVSIKVLGNPIVSSVSNYNFAKDSIITLTGKNLSDVTKVAFADAGTDVTIVSKTNTTLTVKMPATTLTRTFLKVTNGTGTITTTQEFVNVDKAYVIFADTYGAGIENGSWGPAEISTTVFKSGNASFAATYKKGNWSADGFAAWSNGFTYSADYKYMTFWVKGGSTELTFYLTGDQRSIGYGNSDRNTPITVPANVWTYFKLPMSSIDLWNKGTLSKQLGFWIAGPDTQDETIYIDDVFFVK